MPEARRERGREEEKKKKRRKKQREKSVWGRGVIREFKGSEGGNPPNDTNCFVCVCLYVCVSCMVTAGNSRRVVQATKH